MKVSPDIKEAKPLSAFKANIFEALKESAKEVRLIKKGKLKGIQVKDLLKNL